MCEIFRMQLTDYLERSLPLSDRERFEAHLSACEPCRSALDVTRGMIVAYERLDWFAFGAGFLFIFLLTDALIYAWRKDALEWI